MENNYKVTLDIKGINLSEDDLLAAIERGLDRESIVADIDVVGTTTRKKKVTRVRKYEITAYVNIPETDPLMAEQIVEDLLSKEGWTPSQVVADAL